MVGADKDVPARHPESELADARQNRRLPTLRDVDTPAKSPRCAAIRAHGWNSMADDGTFPQAPGIHAARAELTPGGHATSGSLAAAGEAPAGKRSDDGDDATHGNPTIAAHGSSLQAARHAASAPQHLPAPPPAAVSSPGPLAPPAAPEAHPAGAAFFVAPSSYLRLVSRAAPAASVASIASPTGSRPVTRNPAPMHSPLDREQIDGLVS